MPPVWYGRIVDRLTFWNNLIAGKLADTIVAYTEDFARTPRSCRALGLRNAEGSETCRHDPSKPHGKVRVILPVVIPDPTPEGVAALRERIGLTDAARDRLCRALCLREGRRLPDQRHPAHSGTGSRTSASCLPAPTRT